MSESGGPATANVMPTGATTDVVVSSGVIVNNTATATMAAVTGKTNFCTGFSVTGQAPTAAGTITVTLSGATPMGRYVLDLPAAANAPFAGLFVTFPRPIPALGQNLAMAVSAPAFGAGSTAQAVNIYGYTQ